MATFVCLHGAGGRASSWDLVIAELERRGHRGVAVDLPCDQPVPLDAYADVAVEAVEQLDDRNEVVLLAQSLAGLVAPLVAARVPVRLMVLLAAMVPSPGETGQDWWANTGQGDAFLAQGLPGTSDEIVFTHDVDPAVLEATAPPRDQTDRLFEDPWPLPSWPDVPTEFLLCEDDRFFPPAWLRGVVRDRLGIEPRSIPGGHCAFLSQPAAVADAAIACWDEVAADA
jgi:pimeloyl-ACP methyl ester carboxylesterase